MGQQMVSRFCVGFAVTSPPAFITVCLLAKAARRTIRKQIQYRACRKVNGCFIVRINRNKCQHCRIQKCFAVGMSYEGVRLGRCPKWFRPAQTSFMYIPYHPAIDSVWHSRIEQLVLNVHAAHGKASTDFNAFAAVFDGKKEVILERSDMKHFYSRYLPGIVRFTTTLAKDIPQFTSLSKYIQCHLIRGSLFELATITSCFVLEPNCKDLVHNSLSLVIPKERLEVIGIFRHMFKDMSDVRTKLTRLHLTDVELSVLLALVLFCPDREGLAYSLALENTETDLCIALKCLLILSHGDGTVTFAKAVEILTELRSITAIYVDDIFSSQVEIDGDTSLHVSL